MEQLSAPKSSTALTYGLYLGIAAIIFNLITFYGGLIGNKPFSWIGVIIPLIFVFLGLKNYKEKVNNGILKYSSGLGLGVLLSLVGGVVSAIFIYILLSFIDASLMNTILAVTEEQLLEKNMPEAAIEQSVKFVTPTMMAIGTVVSTVFFGFVGSLIISAILKKDAEVSI